MTDRTIWLPVVPGATAYPLADGARLIPVVPGSPRLLRCAVFQVARYFAREFDALYVPYECDDREAHVGFLFASPDRAAVMGACVLRWRGWNLAPWGFGLQWIWLHPCARRRGHLRAAWGLFRALFGAFEPEPPLSRAMQGFMANHAAGIAPTPAPAIRAYLLRCCPELGELLSPAQ
jgi:hypothetical protein